MYIKFDCLCHTGSFVKCQREMSNSFTIPYTMRLFECVVLNFSSCDLDKQPSYYYNAITFDLSNNKLTSWHFNPFTKIFYLHGNK